ncbi:MAG: hypothetical protein EBY58_00270 [Rhodobacteraceae bacterium]|nr:hypothetical protein [Paracoccaceae bacterium]
MTKTLFRGCLVMRDARREFDPVPQDILTKDDRILAIGDGITTDIQGAIGEGIDSLFITGGLAAKETATATQPDSEKLSQYVVEKQLDPTFSIGFLR